MAILLSTLSCSGQEGNLPDKKTMAVIKKAENVCMYLIDPMTDVFSNGEIQGYAVAGNRIEVSNVQKDSLFSLVQGSFANYKSSETVKMSTFIPECAFQFVKANDTVNLLLDFHADIMSFAHKAKNSKLSFAKTHEPLVSFVNSLKPKDESPLMEGEVDSKSMIPKEILDKIVAADSLTWYIIDALGQPSASVETFNNALILQQKGDKNAKLVSAILSAPSSFVKSDRIKESVFMPDLGIRMLVNNKPAVDILFSFYCDECKIISGENIFQSDCQRIKKDIVKTALNVFPTDKYLRVLSNQ